MDFKQWLEVATLSGSGIMPPPPMEDEGDEDDSDFPDWDKLPNLITQWMRRKDVCYKSILESILDAIFNKNEDYKPTHMYFDAYPGQHWRENQNKPNAKVEFQWLLHHNNPKFDKMKEQIQDTMSHCKSLWSSIKLINGWKYSYETYFFNKFLNVFLYNVKNTISTEAQVSGAHILKNRKIKFKKYNDTLDKILLNIFKAKLSNAPQDMPNDVKISKMFNHGYTMITPYSEVSVWDYLEFVIEAE